MTLSGKNALRAAYRKRRDEFCHALPKQVRNIAFSNWPSPARPFLTPGKIVAGYHAINSEADPAKLLDLATSLGCTLALPHVTGKLSPMRFLQYDSQMALEPSVFGLKQPPIDNAQVTPDVVLVPLIAFDRSGSRLGQGAGHYDRALSLLDGAIKIGLAWSCQEADALETDVWDIPLDAILTEREWILP